MTELIASQPGFWPISEPLNIRLPWIQGRLGITDFSDLYGKKADERLWHYYHDLLKGRLWEFKLRPGLRFYRPITRRIVIKQNQGALDRIGWIEDNFGIRAVHLLRHPIAVALSRKVFPLLPVFGRCALREQFTAAQLSLADRVIASGSHLEKGIVAWCLHHVPALRQARPSWTVVTYEETVLNPELAVDRLATNLGLPNRQRLLRSISRPSQVTRKSDWVTQKILYEKVNRRQLISKWKARVSADDRIKVQSILAAFKVHVYSADSCLPNKTKFEHQ